MADKGLLVGINDYIDAPLRGCLNDVTDMAEFLVGHLDFDPGSIRLLTDKRATTKNILDRLEWLVDGAKPGDRLVFLFSGHGVQIPTRDRANEVDGLDECIAPHNFDWEDEVVRDDDFVRIFSKLPAGVKMLWASDSCHSGSMSKDLTPPGMPVFRPKFLTPPTDIAWRFRALAGKPPTIKAKKKAAQVAQKPLPLVFISGCKDKQTSADALFNGRSNGAMTYFLLRALEAPMGLQTPIGSLLKGIRTNIKRAGYTQIPQLEGNAALFDSPILG